VHENDVKGNALGELVWNELQLNKQLVIGASYSLGTHRVHNQRCQVRQLTLQPKSEYCNCKVILIFAKVTPVNAVSTEISNAFERCTAAAARDTEGVKDASHRICARDLGSSGSETAPDILVLDGLVFRSALLPQTRAESAQLKAVVRLRLG
jgi:hypothetical protein